MCVSKCVCVCLNVCVSKCVCVNVCVFVCMCVLHNLLGTTYHRVMPQARDNFEGFLQAQEKKEVIVDIYSYNFPSVGSFSSSSQPTYRHHLVGPVRAVRAAGV